MYIYHWDSEQFLYWHTGIIWTQLDSPLTVYWH